ncbi:MAG TPA: hypothetical protein VJU86_04790 [Pyrinomonadaceae bacterium]|nr:hypothetical protein [Pyrinomonadaceae bacterium]
MRHPTFPTDSFLSIRTIVCVALSFASILIVAAPGRAQTYDKFSIQSDKNKPVEAPKKRPSAEAQRGQPDKNGKTREIFAPLSGCVYNDILVLDTIRIVFVRLTNFPENSAIPVTLTQTNAGVVGYALTPAGPFTPTLNLVVNTDSNGYGESVDVYTQGQLVGTTVTYGETPYGPTDTINFNVLPQCNCPSIPVVP